MFPVRDTHDGPHARWLALSTLEATSVGTGFISGLASAILGIAAFGVVLSLRFPAQLAFDELRQRAPLSVSSAWPHDRKPLAY